MNERREHLKGQLRRIIAAEYARHDEYTVSDLMNRTGLSRKEVILALRSLMYYGLVKAEVMANNKKPTIWRKT